MKSNLWLVIAALAIACPQAARAQNPGPTVLKQCVVLLIDEAEVPAQEAGTIIALDAKEGLYVKEGTKVAQINDDQARSEKLVAEKEEAVARVQAESNVEVLVAYKAAMVAREEYNGAIEANVKAAGAKSASEIRAKLFAFDKAVLQQKKAEQDRSIARTTVEARVAQVAQAQNNVERREIKAPLTGEVVKVHLHLGEWAAPGAPVMRIVRLDRLRVEGFIDPKQISPSEIVNRAVTFETELARGRKEKFTGKITYVNFEVEGSTYKDQTIRVWAEVVNRQEGEQWLLRPGASGEMSIDVGGPIANKPPAPVAPGPKLSSMPPK